MWPFLGLLVITGFKASAAALRENVVVAGTTKDPNFVRPEGEFLPKCPPTHPYALDGGKHCCRAGVEIDDIGLADGSCDGQRINVPSALECCMDGLVVACEDQQKGCNHYPVSCSVNATLDSVNSVYAGNSAIWGAEHVLKYEDCDEYYTYWLANDLTNNTWFIIDLGCDVVIDRFFLRNTRDSIYNWRGTELFSLEMSYDRINWLPVLEGTLANVKDVDRCQLPTEEFDAVGHGRYIRFTAKTHYYISAGLNWISWRIKK